MQSAPRLPNTGAEQALANGGLTDKEYRIAEAKLQRALVRLSVKRIKNKSLRRIQKKSYRRRLFNLKLSVEISCVCYKSKKFRQIKNPDTARAALIRT